MVFSQISPENSTMDFTCFPAHKHTHVHAQKCTLTSYHTSHTPCIFTPSCTHHTSCTMLGLLYDTWHTHTMHAHTTHAGVLTAVTVLKAPCSVPGPQPKCVRHPLEKHALWSFAGLFSPFSQAAVNLDVQFGVFILFSLYFVLIVPSHHLCMS